MKAHIIGINDSHENFHYRKAAAKDYVHLIKSWVFNINLSTEEILVCNASLNNIPYLHSVFLYFPRRKTMKTNHEFDKCFALRIE